MADLRGNSPGHVSFYRAAAIVLVIFRTGHTIVGVLLQRSLGSERLNSTSTALYAHGMDSSLGSALHHQSSYSC